MSVAEAVAAVARGVAEAGADEGVLLLRELPVADLDPRLQVGARRHLEAQAGREDVRAAERAVAPRDDQVAAARAEQRIEGVRHVAGRGARARRVVELEGEPGRPGGGARVADLEMARVRLVVEIGRDARGAAQHRAVAELSHPFELVVPLPGLRRPQRTCAERVVATRERGAARDLVVQAEVVGVEVQPGDALVFESGAPEALLALALVLEVARVELHRPHVERARAPAGRVAEREVDAVEGVRGVAIAVTRDQAARAEVEAHAPEVEVRAQLRAEQLAARVRAEELRERDLVDRGAGEVVGPVPPGARILQLGQEAEAGGCVHAHAQPRALRILALRVGLAGAERLVEILETRALLEREVEPLGQAERVVQDARPGDVLADQRRVGRLLRARRFSVRGAGETQHRTEQENRAHPASDRGGGRLYPSASFLRLRLVGDGLRVEAAGGEKLRERELRSRSRRRGS